MVGCMMTVICGRYCKIEFCFHTFPGASWPLNFHFTFDLLAVLTVLTAAISLALPKNIEKKRDTIEKD